MLELIEHMLLELIGISYAHTYIDNFVHTYLTFSTPPSFSPHPLLALQIHEREEMGTVISIGNLTLKNTITLVAEALDIDEDIEEIRYLGFIVQKKT